MTELYDMKAEQEKQERVILVGVAVNEGDDTEESLDELAELFVNAGRRGVVVAVSPGALDVVSPVRGDLVSMSPRRV